MLLDNLYRTESDKSTTQFAEDLSQAVRQRGFMIHNEITMEMAHSLTVHPVVKT